MQSVGLRIGSSDLIGLDWIWIWPPIQSSQSKLYWSSWISNSHPVKKSANRTISNLGLSSSLILTLSIFYSTSPLFLHLTSPHLCQTSPQVSGCPLPPQLSHHLDHCHHSLCQPPAPVALCLAAQKCNNQIHVFQAARTMISNTHLLQLYPS